VPWAPIVASSAIALARNYQEIMSLKTLSVDLSHRQSALFNERFPAGALRFSSRRGIEQFLASEFGY